MPADADEAEHAFYEAFEAADLEAMMALWADDDTITCTHPGGARLSGQEEVRESWRQIFASRVRLRFTLGSRHAIGDGGLVVHNVLEEITREGSDEPVALVVATNVFVETNAGWKIWMHHGSAISTAPEGLAGETPTPTLH